MSRGSCVPFFPLYWRQIILLLLSDYNLDSHHDITLDGSCFMFPDHVTDFSGSQGTTITICVELQQHFSLKRCSIKPLVLLITVTSGAKYSGVPQKVFMVAPSVIPSLHSPKSVILMWPSLSNMRFSSCTQRQTLSFRHYFNNVSVRV